MNDICDYEQDKKDKGKKHFPLMTGEIKLHTAVNVCIISQVMVVLFGLCLAKGYYSLFFLATMIFFAILYNLQCKKSYVAPVYISLAFASLFAFTYSIGPSNFSILFWLVFVYLFFQMLFQNSVSGYITDIDVDKINLMRRLGCKISNGEFISNKIAVIYAGVIKLAIIPIGLSVLYIANTNTIGYIGFGVFAVLSCICMGKLILTGKFDRRVKWCVAIEVCVYFALVFALFGESLANLLFFTLFPILCLILMNLYLFHTVFTPKI